jgi:hypothetical protein
LTQIVSLPLEEKEKIVHLFSFMEDHLKDLFIKGLRGASEKTLSEVREFAQQLAEFGAGNLAKFTTNFANNLEMYLKARTSATPQLLHEISSNLLDLHARVRTFARVTSAHLVKDQLREQEGPA